jgi:2-iminobutanoate/2-iminopropanoate deaminase
MEIVFTPNAPAPAGHYSQAVVHGGLVYVAGQLPIDPAMADRAPGTIEEQTECALANVKAILEAAGSGLSHVLQTTVYISDISLWSRVNAAYAKVLGKHRPARAVVPVKDLHHGCQIEIQAIAVLPGTELSPQPLSSRALRSSRCRTSSFGIVALSFVKNSS